MLKGIPAILSPELLKVLMEMGHGDEITIGDGNYPAASTARMSRPRLAKSAERMDGAILIIESPSFLLLRRRSGPDRPAGLCGAGETPRIG